MGKCAKRAFQNGGAVSKADQLMAEMAAKYGVSGQSQAASMQQPAPQPQPKPQPLPQQQGIASGIFGIMQGRQQQIDKASGYRNGGKIQGPGTPTSDSIPAKVKETGEGIAVSTNERILSADQDAMLEAMARKSGFDNLDAMLEAGTGKPVGPTIKGGKRAAAGGWSLDNNPDEYAKALQQQVLGRDAQGNGSSWSVGAGQKPTIGVMPVQSDRVSGSLPVATQPQKSSPLVEGVRPWYAGSSTADNRTGLEMERERRAEASSAGVLNDPVKSALQFGVIGQPDQKAVAAQSANQNYGNEGRATRGDISVPSSNRAGSQSQNTPAQVSGRNNQGIITADSAAVAYGKDGARTNLGTMNLAEQNERMAKSLGYAGTDDFNKQFRLRNDPVQQQAELAANGQAQSPSQRQNAEIDSQLKRGQLKQQGLIAGLQDKAAAGDVNALNELKMRGIVKFPDDKWELGYRKTKDINGIEQQEPVVVTRDFGKQQQVTPQQEYQNAIAAAKGDPAKIKLIQERARQNGVIQ